MKIEDQVISLELAKRLKELVIKQDSLFYWADGTIVNSVDMELLLDNGKVRTLSGIHNDYPDQDVNELYSAFTTAELLDIMPPSINGCCLQLIKEMYLGREYPEYFCKYNMLSMHYRSIEIKLDKNPANALAIMLVYLMKNGIYKP